MLFDVCRHQKTRTSKDSHTSKSTRQRAHVKECTSKSARHYACTSPTNTSCAHTQNPADPVALTHLISLTSGASQDRSIVADQVEYGPFCLRWEEALLRARAVDALHVRTAMRPSLRSSAKSRGRSANFVPLDRAPPFADTVKALSLRHAPLRPHKAPPPARHGSGRAACRPSWRTRCHCRWGRASTLPAWRRWP